MVSGGILGCGVGVYGVGAYRGRSRQATMGSFVGTQSMYYRSHLKVAILLKGNYTKISSGVGSSGGEEPQGPSPCRLGLPISR